MFGSADEYINVEVKLTVPKGKSTTTKKVKFKSRAKLWTAIVTLTKSRDGLIKSAKKAKTSGGRALYAKLISRQNKNLAALKAGLKKGDAQIKARAAARAKGEGSEGMSWSREEGMMEQSAQGLTPQQIAMIQALIRQMTAQGADADQAEEAAKRRVLPPQLLMAIPRGYFRGVRRAGPRPALPPTQQQSYAPMPGELPGPTRDIDPTVQQRPIDPMVQARPVDPVPQVRPIDPNVGGAALVAQAGSFTFPPGNVSDVDPDTLSDGLDGIVDTVKEYAAKPWVLGLVALGAVLYGPKLLAKAKGMMKKNPRRRVRRNRRNRR